MSIFKWSVSTLILLLSLITNAQHQINNPNALETKLQEALERYAFDEALTIADSIEEYSLIKNDTLFLGYAYQIRAEIYKFKSNLPKSKQNLKKAIEIYERAEDTSRIIALNASLSSIYRIENQLDSSRLSLDRAKPFVNSNTDSLARQFYYNQLSSLYETKARIDSSIYYVLKRVAITNSKNHYALATAYLQLASLFYKVQDYDKALSYCNQSLMDIDASNSKLQLTKIKVLVAKSYILLAKDDNENALKTLDRAKLNLLSGKHDEYRAQIAIAEAQIQYNNKNYRLLTDTLVENKKISSPTLLHYYTIQLKHAEKLNLASMVKNYYLKGKEIAPQVSNLNLKKGFYESSQAYWASQGNYSESYANLSKAQEITSQINQRIRAYTAYDLETKYQLAKKETALAEQDFKIKQKTTQNNILWALMSCLALLGVGVWLLFNQNQKRKNQEIITLKRERQISSLEALIQGEEKERSRIAKDLHDGVNGDLSAIKHVLSKYQDLNGIDLSEPIKMVDRSCDQVRAISHNLIPPSLENYSLKESLDDFCSNMNAINQEVVSFQYIGDDFEFSKSAEVTIFRIVQELLNNSLRHANAKDILIQLANFNGVIQLTVEDDGKGFDVNTMSKKGLGLSNIKSRTRFLQGELEIVSNEEGTQVNIVFDKLKLYEG